MACSGEGCTNTHIQNKKHNLCGDCVFKKSHGGKSKQEVYAARAAARPKKANSLLSYQFRTKEEYDNLKKSSTVPSPHNQHYHVDEVSAMNARNQDLAEQREKEEQGFSNVEGLLNTRSYKVDESTLNHRSFVKWNKPKKPKKPIKQISSKQAEINRAYALTCADMDYVEEKVCSGCLRYQGGDIRLSHSHVISRADCKRIGREDLIYDKENLRYHCMDFGENEGCHRKHEGVSCIDLNDFEKNFYYIYTISKELFNKRITKLFQQYEGDLERCNKLRGIISNLE